jgi:hypothetical protein
MRSADAEETPCAMSGCGVLCEGRTCSSRCRSALWKVETGYRDRRSVRNAAQRRSRPSQVRDALVEIQGSTIEVLGFAAGKGKRSIERAFGIIDRGNLAAIAERHLPAVI